MRRPDPRKQRADSRGRSDAVVLKSRRIGSASFSSKRNCRGVALCRTRQTKKGPAAREMVFSGESPCGQGAGCLLSYEHARPVGWRVLCWPRSLACQSPQTTEREILHDISSARRAKNILAPALSRDGRGSSLKAPGCQSAVLARHAATHSRMREAGCKGVRAPRMHGSERGTDYSEKCASTAIRATLCETAPAVSGWRKRRSQIFVSAVRRRQKCWRRRSTLTFNVEKRPSAMSPLYSICVQ